MSTNSEWQNTQTMFALPQHWAARALEEPETGMGYQTVNIVFKNKLRLANCQILNAALLYISCGMPRGYTVDDIKDIVFLPKTEDR